MTSKRVLFIAIIGIFISCNRQSKPEGISVTGHFLNASGKKIYFSELDFDAINNLDSTILDEKGAFRFNRKTTNAGFYLLAASTGENVLLLMEKEELAVVEADFKKVPFDYDVSGSPGSTLLKNFYSETFPQLSKADSLASNLKQLKNTPEFYPKSVEYEPLFQKIMDDQKKLEKGFIQNNNKSMASLIVLNYKFGMMPVLQEDQDFYLYLMLDSTLSVVYPSNKHVLFLHQKVIEHQQEVALERLRKEEQKKK
jgi:hypothetical protein